METSIMESITQAEAEAKEIIAAAERQRSERLLAADAKIAEMRQEQQRVRRRREQEYLAEISSAASGEAEQTILKGRTATAHLEDDAHKRMPDAVAAVLRKVL